MEIRLYGFAPEDKGGIMIDSFEFIGERGNAVERPEYVNVNVTPLPEQSAPVAENSASPAPTGTASSQPQQKNGSVWIITAACACAAVAAAACIVIALKSAAEKKGVKRHRTFNNRASGRRVPFGIRCLFNKKSKNR